MWESAITAIVHEGEEEPAAQPGSLPGITVSACCSPGSSPTPRDHLMLAFAEAAQRLEALRAHERQMRQAQQRSVLELKASTDISFGKIRAANERRTQQEKQAAMRRQQEAKAILQSGGNPHAVFRSRQVAERREREEVQLDAKRRQAEARIAAMVVREEEQVERGTRQAQRAKARELKQRSPSRA